MPDFLQLQPWDEQGRLRVVVETPRGSGFKIHYDGATGAFTFQRPLRGQHYPHDWGFVPGTKAEDGDPLDALLLHEDATWPGIVVPCEPIAVLKIRERKSGAAEEVENDRVIAVPSVAQPSSAGAELSSEKKRELEQFFQNTGEQGGKKQVRVVGWGDANEARLMIQRTCTVR